jgi:MFS family permease
MVAFGVGETMLSPSLAPLVNGLAPDHLRGRYNAASTMAWTTGFALGPALAGGALRAGFGSALFAALLVACGLLSAAAIRLERHLPDAANRIGPPTGTERLGDIERLQLEEFAEA